MRRCSIDAKTIQAEGIKFPRIMIAIPRLGNKSSPLIVSHSRRHSNAVQVRDVPDFIGPMAASSPGPHIPCGAYFLAGGARTRSFAVSPMCSDLRDHRGGRRRRLCCRAHPSSAVNLTRLCDYGTKPATVASKASPVLVLMGGGGRGRGHSELLPMKARSGAAHVFWQRHG